MKKSFKRLVIDTASEYMYLALLIDDKEMDTVYEFGHQNHSVTILPFIEQLLKKADLELTDIDEVIIGIGPGSYTGVRIGVSIAKMIGYLNNIPLKSISSLALLASSSDKRYIVPSIDARRGNSFIALYELTDGRLAALKEDTLTSTEDFLNNLQQPFDFVVSGKPQIQKIIHSDLLTHVENVHELVPNYLQITEAERNLCRS